MITSEDYSKRLNIEPSQCDCLACQYMCHAPCCGSVEDMEKLIEAGYGNRLMFDDLPSTSDGGNILKPALKGHEGQQAPWETHSVSGCTFWKNGKCELHDKGLKPIQGKLAIHGGNKSGSAKYAEISKEDWESERGLEVIEKWKRLVKYQQTDED